MLILRWFAVGLLLGPTSGRKKKETGKILENPIHPWAGGMERRPLRAAAFMVLATGLAASSFPADTVSQSARYHLSLAQA